MKFQSVFISFNIIYKIIESNEVLPWLNTFTDNSYAGCRYPWKINVVKITQNLFPILQS